MSAADLRAEAKALRKRARELEQEAEGIESAMVAEARRATSRAAHEAKAATMCRPVWKSEALEGVYVVVAIENGCFMLRNLLAVGGNVGPYPYRTRDGRFGGSMYEQSVAIRRAHLDNVATMNAWREWCSARRVVAE